MTKTVMAWHVLWLSAGLLAAASLAGCKPADGNAVRERGAAEKTEAQRIAGESQSLALTPARSGGEPLERLDSVFGVVFGETCRWGTNPEKIDGGAWACRFEPDEPFMGCRDYLVYATARSKRVFCIRAVFHGESVDEAWDAFESMTQVIERETGGTFLNAGSDGRKTVRYLPIGTGFRVILTKDGMQDAVVLDFVGVDLQAENAREKQEMAEIAARAAAEKAEAEARPLFAKAQQATENGATDFFGFYLGMPEEDALALARYYGLDEKDWHASTVSSGTEVDDIWFNWNSLRRLAKTGSVDETEKAVVDRVGGLEECESPLNADWSGKYYERGGAFTGEDWVFLRRVDYYMDGETEVGKNRLRFEMDGRSRFRKLDEKRKEEMQAAWKHAEPVTEAEMKRAAALGTGSVAGETKTITLPGGVTMDMVWCPPGGFTMGSPEGEDGRHGSERQHPVDFRKGFWIAKYEVTQKQWKSVMGRNPVVDLEKAVFGGYSYGAVPYVGDDVPVFDVPFSACMQFCMKTGLRLPTEEEWEYACRAGSTGPYAGTGRLDDMGWYKGNSGAGNDSLPCPRPVGSKKPNAWGLYDMHGNVGEYCLSWNADDSNPWRSAWEEKKRGGGYSDPAWLCRSACRRDSDSAGLRPIAVVP